MGRKLGLTLEQIIEAAAAIADRDGIDALSMSKIASSLGVRSPSLYNHIDGLAGIRRRLALHASSLLTAEFTAGVDGVAGVAGTDALRAIASRLRTFAHDHPGLYGSLLPAPDPGEDPELAAALAEPVDVVRRVLTGMDIDPSTLVPIIRSLRAAIHGFVDLELRGGFGLPDDIESSFATTVDLVIAAISAPATIHTDP